MTNKIGRMTPGSDRLSFVSRHPFIIGTPHALLPYLAIVALYIVCAFLVDPRGEFPLNDDWSYTRSAFRFGAEGRMQVDEWAAPNLVGQALYGALLTKTFGAHFLTLRLSTLILSCLTACMLWATLRQLQVSAGLAVAAVLAWIFNPVWFCLSFTFMTEIPFLFFVAAATLCYALYSVSSRYWLLLAGAAALGYAYLIRQTAILFLVPMLVTLVFSGGHKATKLIIRRALLLCATAGVFIAGYSLWSLRYGGFRPAATRKFELLSKISSAQILGNSFGLLFYLALFSLPLVICLIPRLVGLWRKAGNTAWLYAAGWMLIPGAGLYWFYARYSNVPYLPGRAFHARMPFLLNVLYDTGVGPITLDPTYYGKTPTPVYPHLWLAVTFACAAAAAILGLLLTLSIIRFRVSSPDRARDNFLLYSALSFLSVIAFEVMFSHTQEGGLFDRHILTAALPLFFLVALSGERSRDQKSNEVPQVAGLGDSGGKSTLRNHLNSHPHIFSLSHIGSAGAGLALAGLAWFSITATHDYLAWNRLRWDLGNQLLAARVDPLSISGGFEFNAWHNYDTFRARGNIGKVYYWWYDRLDYLITMEPQEAYHVLQKKEYFSWLHRTYLPIYLLGRDGPKSKVQCLRSSPGYPQSPPHALSAFFVNRRSSIVNRTSVFSPKLASAPTL